MDFEEQMQEEHAVRQILSEDSGETLRRRRDIVPPLTTRSEQDINERFREYNINIANNCSSRLITKVLITLSNVSVS